MTRSALAFALVLSAAGAFAAPQARSARAFTVPDRDVQTESGATRRFYSDLIKGRVVVMNFVFTSCTTVCPTMGATFARVQKLLAESGSNARLISVSIDPSNDTPQRLASWSQRLGGRPGWTLVTGNPTDIEAILQSFGLYTSDPASHAPVVLVGNDAEGRWERVDGLAAPKAIVEAVRRIEGAAK